MYKEVLQAFLKVTPFKDVLERQHKFIDSLVTLIRTVTKESGNRKKKIERMQQLLQVSENMERKAISISFIIRTLNNLAWTFHHSPHCPCL